MLRKVLNLTPFPWNFRRQTPFKVYRAFDGKNRVIDSEKTV